MPFIWHSGYVWTLAAATRIAAFKEDWKAPMDSCLRRNDSITFLRALRVSA
jgi:hypothetical protein